MAWTLNCNRAKKHTRLIIVGADNEKKNEYYDKMYVTPLIGINFWPNTKQKEKCLVVDITDIATLRSLHKNYKQHIIHSKLNKIIDHESYFVDSKDLQGLDDNERKIISFNKENIQRGNLGEDFVGLNNPICYIGNIK